MRDNIHKYLCKENLYNHLLYFVQEVLKGVQTLWIKVSFTYQEDQKPSSLYSAKIRKFLHGEESQYSSVYNTPVKTASALLFSLKV